jgi:hypothetical protein
VSALKFFSGLTEELILLANRRNGRMETQGANAYLYIGMFLLACFGSIHYFLYLRLRDTGYKKHIFNFLVVVVPVDYLRVRAKYGWSPWPAYLVWPALIGGLVVLTIGVFKL